MRYTTLYALHSTMLYTIEYRHCNGSSYISLTHISIKDGGEHERRNIEN